LTHTEIVPGIGLLMLLPSRQRRGPVRKQRLPTDI
jgi:hypothetical protein